MFQVTGKQTNKQIEGIAFQLELNKPIFPDQLTTRNMPYSLTKLIITNSLWSFINLFHLLRNF